MKRMILMCVLSLAVLAACHQRTTIEKNPVPITEVKGVKIDLKALAVNKDLVCGMLLENGSIADTALYKDKLYGFCSAECKTQFVDSPQVYLALQ